MLEETLDGINKEASRKKVELEVYCPMTEILLVSRGIDTRKLVPLFFNYMFLWFDSNKWSPNRMSESLHIRFVRFGDRIAILESDEVDRIRSVEKLLLENRELMLSDEEYMAQFVGHNAKIKEGPLGGLIGTIFDVRRAGVYDVKVSIFNREATCQVSVDSLEIEN